MGRGHRCPRTTVKCASCGGPHGARAEACSRKREARQATRGWQSQPPPLRERKASETDAPAAQVGLGEAEVEGEVQPGAEDVARAEGRKGGRGYGGVGTR